MATLPACFGPRLAHPRCAPVDIVEPGERDHLHDGAHAPTFTAYQESSCVFELHLTRGVCAVAEFVLEPLDHEDVSSAIVQHAWNEETTKARRRLGQHQEGIRHRRADEPLVSSELPDPFADFHGRSRVGADI